MKKLNLLILFALLINGVNAQNNMYFGFTGGIDMYNYQFWGFPKKVTVDSLNFNFPKGEHKFEQVLNYNTGIVVGYKINKLYLTADIKYSAKDYKIDYNMDSYTVSSGSYQIIFLPVDYSVLRFRYIDIGINAGYNILKLNKINIIPSIGFKSGLLINKESKVIYEDKTVYVDKNNTDFLAQHNPEKMVYATYFNLGIEYNINTDISFVLTPNFVQYLNQLTSIPMKQNPMSYGINFSILYKLNNTSNE